MLYARLGQSDASNSVNFRSHPQLVVLDAIHSILICEVISFFVFSLRLRALNMNSFDDTLEDVEISVHGRRKRKDKSSHSREIIKRARLSCGGKIASINCTHRASEGTCRAEYLSQMDLALNQEKFYAHTSKVDQDAHLLRLVQVRDAKRTCVKEDERKKKRNAISIFHLLTNQGQGHMRVCKPTLCSVLGISQDRVTRVARYFNEHKEARPENRGGRRNASVDDDKRQAVTTHIMSFQCKPSHYSRRNTPGRKYLPCELSVAKMHAMFLQQDHVNVTVSYSFYHSVFTGNFNLGFGHPASDACGTCLQFKSKVKDTSLSDDQRKVIAAEFILHRRKARVFYNRLKNVEDTITLCFDVMENLVLPRTPVGQAYYSRQLYLYVFGLVIHRSDGSQSINDIHLFIWQENENRKDSNMIASAVQSFLLNILPQHLGTCSELRLFSDSCFGQNKNINMLSMLMAWKTQHQNQLKINYTFPIRGHSFLPPDRVFGRIEQDIRKHNSLLLPEDYLPILNRHGIVHQYQKDWQSFDFKAETAKFTKKVRPFRLSDARVLELNTSTIGIKSSYSGDFSNYSILKKGKRWDNFQPEVLPPVSMVKDAKKTDVMKLLQEISAPDNVMNYYRSILDVDSPRTSVDTDDDNDNDSDNY